jgi:hypothetical protein
VSVVCCQVEVSATSGPSSRGVLPSVVCLMCVIMKPRNEEAQAPEKGLLSHKKKDCLSVPYRRCTSDVGYH